MRRVDWSRARRRAPRWLCLLTIGWLMAGGSCDGRPTPDGTRVQALPEFGARVQEFQTTVDEGADGVIDASDVGTTTTAAPGQLSNASATQSVSMYASRDVDTVYAECGHALQPGTSETVCTGVIRAAFIAAGSGNIKFDIVAIRAPSAGQLPPFVDSVVTGEVTIGCGGGPGVGTTETVMNPPPGGPAGVEIYSLYDIIAGATPGEVCEVEIDLTASVTTNGLAEPLTVIQTVSVTAPISTTPVCVTNKQCPAERPFCNADGDCGSGGEGSPALVAAEQCQAPFVTDVFAGSRCSEGVSGSFCRGDFECRTGWTCLAGFCRGDTSCSSDADCPPEASICTEQGTCSPFGAQGADCVSTDFCRMGLICSSNSCTAILGQGEDCTQPFTQCDGPFACFPSTDTCEVPLPLGSVCSADIECADYPLDNSCNQAIGVGVCAVRQSPGGPCTQNIDCASNSCDTVGGTCN